MEKVIKILMDRDGVTREEAIELIKDCINAIEEGNFNAMQEYLGLEDDYIFDII